MNRLKDLLNRIPLWNKIPESIQSAILALLLAIGGWLMHRWQGDPKTVTNTVEVVKEVPSPEQLRDESPIDYEGVYIHGVCDVEHIEANGRPFPGRDIRYWIDYSSVPQLRPALSNEMISASIKQAWGWWAEGLDINPQEVSDRSQAHLVMSFSRRVFDTQDGALGVLAACEMGDGTTRQKRLIFDAAEKWTAGPPAPGLVSMPTVGTHEIGHYLGLGHDDMNAPGVMRPTYSSAIPRPQDRDYQRAIALGYAKKPASPTGPVDVLQVPVQIKTGDVIDALKKAGYKVAK